MKSFLYVPLDITQVRWYWNKQPFNLKAVHQLDVQSRSQLTRYCEEDSNALEQEYRTRAEELEKAWWSEQAELSSGPAAAGKNAVPEDETASTKWQDYVLGDRKDEVGMPVKSGLHEVDMVKRRMQPCYWPGTTHRVIRGSWFVDKGSGYAPLKETVADELEEAYRSHVWDPSLRHAKKQKQGVTAARVELTSLFTKGQYALFVSGDEAYLCTDTTFGSWFSRKGTPPGARLRRGYLPPKPSDKQAEIDIKQEEVENYCGRVPVDRLVLACHGIGQKLAVSNIAHDAACMRLLMRQLSQDTMSREQTEEGRVEVLPVQWRKHLNLEVDAISEALMPSGVRGLRSMFHATAVEVLLYLTPVHCQDMLDSLTTSLNATFTSFMKRNPAFQGKVSILAHSLGSVLCYEILCNQPHLFDHLEFNIPSGTPAPSDTSNAAVSFHKTQQSSASETQQQQPLKQQQQQHRQASTEIAFAPMSSRDLDNSGQAGKSCPDFPTPLAKSLPHTSATLGTAAGRKEIPQKSKLEAENERLRLELEAVRADRDRVLSWQQASTSGQAAFGWHPPALPAPKQPQESGGGSLLAPHMTIKPLQFPVDNFICIGSPLGLFLALRGTDPSKGRALGTPSAGASTPSPTSTPDGLPAANRIYNLYQPYDPVAYRMEPLMVSGGQKRKPVFAPYYKGGRRLHIGMAELAEDFGGSVSKAALGSVSVMKLAAGYLGKAVVASKVEKRTDQAGRPLDPNAAAAAVDEEGLDAEEGTPADEADVELKSNASESAIWRLTAGKGEMGVEGSGPLRKAGSTGSGDYSGADKTGEPTSERRTAAGRMDFVLQDSPTENAYLAAIKAHFCYWSSYDTALFVLRAVYGIDVLQESRYASKTKPVKDVINEKASMADAQQQGPRFSIKHGTECIHTAVLMT